MRTAVASAGLLAFASTAAAVKGFNYGGTNPGGGAKSQADFEADFKTAASLEGTSGFNSARLFNMAQSGTTVEPIAAIPAAISTGTTLLLGLWASAGDAAFANELQALKSAITQYGDAFGKVVVGISVGSEDLYRNTPTGIAYGEYAGANPDTLVNYIQQVRQAIAGTALSAAPVGHVDTSNAWVNGSNAAVIEACDFLGQDAYPYYEREKPNSIDNAYNLFFDGLSKTKAVAGGKPIWITETGWPVTGATLNQGVASVENAEKYWQQVGCALFDVQNTWWFAFQDAMWGVIGLDSLTTTPRYNLTCGNVSPPSSAGSASSSAANVPASSSTSPTEAPATAGGSGAPAPTTQVGALPSSLGGGPNVPVSTASVNPGVVPTSAAQPVYPTMAPNSTATMPPGQTTPKPPAASTTVPTVSGAESHVASAGTFVALAIAIAAACLM